MNFGAFSKSDLLAAFKNGRLIGLNGFKQEHVGPASVDITITGSQMYQVKALFKPKPQKVEKVRDVLKILGAKKVGLGHVMEKGQTYVCKASMDVNFPPGVYGVANAKSTSGRNFILVRVISDGIGQYDYIGKPNQGYSGELWLVIQPLCFPIILTDKECYSQLRLFDGDTRFTEDTLKRTLVEHDLLFRHDGSPYKQGELSLFSGDGSVFATIHMPLYKPVGYVAKEGVNEPIDLTRRDIQPEKYWNVVYAALAQDGTGYIPLLEGRHYLLSTNEQVFVPRSCAAELKAIDPRFGLFFSHFAGFIDPDFRAPVTLEVMAPYGMFLRDGDIVARFVYEKMRSETSPYKGNYNDQKGATLPKQFRPFA